jgi:hypothetical protein
MLLIKGDLDVCLLRWRSRVQSQGGELKMFKWLSSAKAQQASRDAFGLCHKKLNMLLFDCVHF